MRQVRVVTTRGEVIVGPLWASGEAALIVNGMRIPQEEVAVFIPLDDDGVR